MAPRHVALGAAAACLGPAACGGAKPRHDPPPQVSAVPLTRVAVDDHDADGDVQLVGHKGHVEPAVALAAIAPHREALSSCYTQRLGKRTWLGGHLVLRWELAADGSVTRLVLAESDLGAWPVERCVLEAAREVTFGVPVGGAAEVSLPLEFSARGKPAIWDDERSARAVGSQLGKLDACARGKVEPPGDVAITLYVGARGRPQSVGFASPSTALDDAWAGCAEKAALSWHLPDPRGQVTKLAVRYRPR